MALAIESKTETITAWDIIPRLARYQMLPQLIRESIIDEAIANVKCTPEEITVALRVFEQQNQLKTEAQRQIWAANQGMSQEDFQEIATRRLKIEKFKIERWGNGIKCYFLKRKVQLDKVSFSVIRISDKDLAQEIYFRVQDNEQSFAELAQQYSEGTEATGGGMVAPIELGSLPPMVAQVLQNRQPGELLPPINVNGAIAIIQINSVVLATLDPMTYQRLINEQFQAWLQKQIEERGIAIKNLSFS